MHIFVSCSVLDLVMLKKTVTQSPHSDKSFLFFIFNNQGDSLFLKGQTPYTGATSSAVKAVSAVRSSPCFLTEVQCSHYILCTLYPLGIMSGFLSFCMSCILRGTSGCIIMTFLFGVSHIQCYFYLQSLHLVFTIPSINSEKDTQLKKLDKDTG